MADHSVNPPVGKLLNFICIGTALIKFKMGIHHT